MLQAINVITDKFTINEHYQREHLSVTLLIMLLNQRLPLPHQITTHFATQSEILDRINDKLLVDTSNFDSLKNALNAILLIVHPDELPLPDDVSKDDELIQDILSFINCEIKNKLYNDLLTTLGITDLTVFNPAELKEENHDGKLDEDDEESVSGGPRHAEHSSMESYDVKDKTIKNRIRNLLIVIGGVYLSDGDLGDLNSMIHDLIERDISKFPNFTKNFDNMLQAITKHSHPHPQLLLRHIFIYLINLLIEQQPESNDILMMVFKRFLGQKLVLFKSESPLSQVTMEGSFDSPGYDTTASAGSLEDSSQHLSPSRDTPPHEIMSEETANNIIELSLSLISSHPVRIIFDNTTLQDYLVYFNDIVLKDRNQVLLRINNPYYQDAIDYLLTYSNSRHGGNKTNKKKVTKRRLVQRRLDKQYSKKKRNTSSNKKKKRVSIKHKRSRTKYHDTRKRRK